MPPSVLSDHLNEVWDAAHGCPGFRAALYDEAELSEVRFYIHFRLSADEGHLLEVRETVELANDGLVVINYSYHFQDPDNALIFRYDSAPHHRVSTFPHHKHLPNGVLTSVKPTVRQVIQEAVDAIIRPESPRGYRGMGALERRNRALALRLNMRQYMSANSLNQSTWGNNERRTR